jgi:hypothetical protein
MAGAAWPRWRVASELVPPALWLSVSLCVLLILGLMFFEAYFYAFFLGQWRSASASSQPRASFR